MMASSLSRMVTGWPKVPQTQAFSQGAGHTRPVNSGKQLVFSSRDRAWLPLPRQSMSFHSGTRLCSGQPSQAP